MDTVYAEEEDVSQDEHCLHDYVHILEGLFVIDYKVHRRKYLQDNLAKPKQIIGQRIITPGERIPNIKQKPIQQPLDNNNQHIDNRNNT